MENEIDLDALDAELTRVSDRLADRHRFEDFSPALRRAAHGPYRLAVGVAALGAALLAAGLVLGNRHLTLPGALLLLVLLPERLWLAARRRKALASVDRELFAELAREARSRFALDVVLLILAVPVLIALAVLLVALPSATWPLWGLAAGAIALPFHVFVRIPRSAKESAEADRWAGHDQDAVDEPDGREPDGHEPGDDEPLVLPILANLVGIFFLYIGPPLSLVLVVLAVRGPDHLRPAVAAALLVVAFALTWRCLDDGEEEGA